MSLFDVIIPTFQNPDTLKKCLEGFSLQTFSDFRILLCIDGNPRQVNNYLMGSTFPFDIIPLQHKQGTRQGPNATRNLALPHVQSEYLLLFDSDCIPTPELMEQHYRILDKSDCFSLGELVYQNSRTNILADYVQSRGKNKCIDQQVLPYKYVTSQNLALKREYFVQIGGQDVDIKSYGGDIEFGFRLGKNFSLPLIYNKKASSYAVWDKDMDTMLEQMREFGSITLPYLKQKYPDLRQVFRVDLITARGFRRLLTRVIINKTIARFFRKLLPRTPGAMSRMMIHYLFFQSIMEGYDSFRKKW
ncbi:MAG: glycosyltransferase [bacterium]